MLVGEPQAGAALVARRGAAGAAAAAQAPAAGGLVGAPTAAAGRAAESRLGVRFQFDQTADGHALKVLNVVDEFTREALVMRVECSVDADRTVQRSGPWSPSPAALRSY